MEISKVFLVLLVCFILLPLMSCDLGLSSGGSRDIIPAKWQGFYRDQIAYLELRPNGVIFWDFSIWNIGSGLIPGATIVNGGIVSGPGLTGEWVYLAINGENQGIIINFPQTVYGYKSFIGMGPYGASDILEVVEDKEGIFSPYPIVESFPGFPARRYDYNFTGVK
jgi:hypothetical protein